MTGGVTTTNDRVCEKDRVAMSVRDVSLRVCMCLCVCMRRVDVSHVMRRVCLSNVGECMACARLVVTVSMSIVSYPNNYLDS